MNVIFRILRKLRYYIVALVVAIIIQVILHTMDSSVLAPGTIPRNNADWVTQIAWLVFCWLAFDWLEHKTYDEYDSSCW